MRLNENVNNFIFSLANVYFFPTFGNILFSQGAANAKRNSPGTSSASSEGNDDAAMAVIMSLLEVTPSDTLKSYFHIHILLEPHLTVRSPFAG